MEFKLFGLNWRLEVVLASMALGFLISMMTLSSCSRVSLREGMEIMNGVYSDVSARVNGDASATTGNGVLLAHSTTKSTPISSFDEPSPMMSEWVSKAHQYGEQHGGDGYQSVLNRLQGNTKGSVPDDSMVFYRDNEFKPECCPSTFSSSSGCMCTTPEQMHHLATRGGNRSASDNF